MGDVLGYFLTLRTYGTWLHGDARGSVDRFNNSFESPLIPRNTARSAYEQSVMKGAPVEFCPQQRFAVDRAIRTTCRFRGWLIHELAVRTNHVHIVITADASTSRLLHDLKSWATRRLKDSRLISEDARVWADHGSTVWLFTDDEFHRAIAYARHEQGAPLPMVRPPHWNDAW